MAEKLGKVKKPSVKKFKKGRKIFFVPLIIALFEPEKEFLELFNKYWEQAQTQVKNLEEKLTEVKKVYHELVTSTGEKGIKAIKQMNTGSYDIVKSSLDKGACRLACRTRRYFRRCIRPSWGLKKEGMNTLLKK